MEKNGLIDLSSVSLTQQEVKLIKNAAEYNTNIPLIIIIIISFSYIWLRHLNLFTQNTFFLIYNAVVYLGFIWATLWTYYYQKKLSRLFTRLIKMVNSPK